MEAAVRDKKSTTVSSSPTQKQVQHKPESEDLHSKS